MLGVPIEMTGRTVQVACHCTRFDDGVLPESGERPVFGVHHLSSSDADWATESDTAREARFRQWVKGAQKGDA